MNYETEHRLMIEIAQQLLGDIRPDGTMRDPTKTKVDEYDFVTEYDEHAHNLIISMISQAFPDDQIVSEESSERNVPLKLTGRIWLTDPICGTTNAALGLTSFVTNLCLIVEGVIVAAIVVDFMHSRIISSKGEGLLIDGQPQGQLPFAKRWLIDVDAGEITKTVTAEEFESFLGIRTQIMLDPLSDLRVLASSLSFALVATGQFQGAIVLQAQSWDVLAAAFLVEQAGGYVTNFAGESYSINTKSLVYAAHPEVKKLLLGQIKEAGLSSVI